MQATSGPRKTRFDLLPPDVLEEIAKVFQDGAVKYTEYGWKGVVSTPEGFINYLSSAYRHLVAMHGGEWVDGESGQPHAAHLAANAMILCWAALHWEEDIPHSEHYEREP